jgi:FixJ family two-component response regulator
MFDRIRCMDAPEASRLSGDDMEPSIFIVDDDPGVRKALSRLLQEGGWACESYESAEVFLAHRDPQATGCLLLDVTLPGLDGLELQGRLAEIGSLLSIVFLTGYGDIPMSVRAIKAGAVDFLTKPVANDALLAAVRAAIRQNALAQENTADTAQAAKRLAGLTAREREVLEAIAAGRLNKQIAADFGIVEQTVKYHRARIMEKLQARSAAELMYIAAKLGVEGKA